jgi:hypothetical protein
MKELGSVVVAGAVEGFGERVRNCLYNKNLSFEDIQCVAGEVFKLKFMKFKTGYILSGHETGDDLKEGLEEIKALAALKRRLYGNCQYVVSVGKLVHHYGTPLYGLPRAASLMNWMETFGGKAAHYPFLDLPRELVSVKSVSGIGGTFIQQLHQDLPAKLSREILLESAIGRPVMGRSYLEEVKRRMEARGIKPKAQFLDFRHEWNPKQHYLLSPLQPMWEAKAPVFEPRLPCLKTVSSVEKGAEPSCAACRSCSKIDLNNPRHSYYSEQESGEGHRAWLRNRELGPSIELSRVKAVKAVNKPSFFYSFIFDVKRGGRLVSKDALARLWFKAWAEEDSAVPVRFRKFVYSFSAHMDYPDMVSNYFGHEAVVAGFSEPLFLEGLEGVWEKVNARCPTIQLVKARQVEDTPSAPGYWIQAELQFSGVVSAPDLRRAEGCFGGSQKFRAYSGSTSRYREVSLPFYRGAGRGSGLVLVLPAKVNPSYSLLELWSYNKFNRMLASVEIQGVFLPAGDGVFLDVVRGHKAHFKSAGYAFVDKAEDDAEISEPSFEIQGA